MVLSDPDDIAWLGAYHTKLIDETHRIFVCEPSLSELEHFHEIRMIPIRTIRVKKKDKPTSRSIQQQVMEILKHPFFVWSNVSGDDGTIMVQPWKNEERAIILAPSKDDQTTWEF